MAGDELVIAQMSDLHFGDGRFDPALMTALIDEVNELEPDLLIVAGDLTERGYLEQFEEAADWLNRIECEQRLVIPGNHDARNVGYVHFSDIFGPRYATREYDIAGEHVLLIGVDTSKPDLNQGELGRLRHLWLYDRCSEPADLKILVLHHHLVSVPGTGRERNILWDAGDILEILAETGVDLVLCGHKHVPFVWEVQGMVLSTSGTACTHRTRGKTPPSFSIVRVGPERIVTTMRNTGLPTGRTTDLPRRVPLEPGAPTRPKRGREAAVAGAGIGTDVGPE